MSLDSKFTKVTRFNFKTNFFKMLYQTNILSIDCVLQDMLDVCVGTSVGTITEPDCLGPCEPGTSVTLEGIVWHETEGGQYTPTRMQLPPPFDFFFPFFFFVVYSNLTL